MFKKGFVNIAFLHYFLGLKITQNQKNWHFFFKGGQNSNNSLEALKNDPVHALYNNMEMYDKSWVFFHTEAYKVYSRINLIYTF